MKYILFAAASLGMLFAIFSTGSRAGYAVAAGSVVAALVITNFRKRRAAGIGLFRIRLATAIISIVLLLRILFAVLAQGLRWRTFHQLLLGTAAGLGAFFALGFLEWVFRQTPVLYQFVITAAFGLSLAALDKEGYLQEELQDEVFLYEELQDDDEAEDDEMETVLQHYALKENSR